MIVKIQVPMFSNEAAPPALVYDRTRRFQCMLPVDEHLRERMGDEPKKYFHVRKTEGGLQILSEAGPQDW